MIKIALGSISSYKSRAVQKVLYELDIEHMIRMIDISSGVSDQPMGKGETLQGAKNRARGALENDVDAEIGLGIEFGYEPFDGGYSMVCYAVIQDRQGNYWQEASSTLRMPQVFIDAVNNNEQGFEQIDKLLRDIKPIQIKRSLTSLMSKRRFIYECVENVFIQYLHRNWY